MPKILHTARYVGTPLEMLKSVVPDGFTIETLEEATYDCLLRQCVDADYFLASGRLPIDERVLSAAKQLKMIQRTGVGTEMLDLEAIKKHGIPVFVNAGVNARSVAEHTIALILACLKRLPQINADTHAGVWKKQLQGVSTHELYGKTVALVGMGNIGRTVAAMLQPFGVKILYTDVVRHSKEVEDDLDLNYFENFEPMLPKADILSFHCPLTSDNREMLNAETIAKMKHGAMVINTARGKLINEEALYEALKERKLCMAAMDVHYEEPMQKDSPLMDLDNVILTPHIGGLSFEAFKRMMLNAVSNIVNFDRGGV
jgi:D-3-phosphoglycerate dehydrogenase